MDVERLEGEVISLCGAGGVCEVMKTGLLLAGLTINFNQRAPLAGLVTSCVTVWDRSGSTFKYVTLVLLGLEPGSSANKVGQLFFFFFILRRMGKNKAQAHHTSTYFHTRRVYS